MVTDSLRRTIVLILGAQRSGTTLLASLIGAHPDVSIVSEDSTLTFTRITGKKIVGTKLIVPNQIQYSKKVRLFGRRDLKVNLSKAIMVNFHKVGILRKKPQCPLSISDFFGYTNTQIVFISRNKEDNIGSMMRRSGWSTDYANWCFQEAIKTRSFLESAHPDKVFLVRYESIKTRDEICERTLKNVCDFIGVEYSQAMLQGFDYNVFYPQSMKSS